MLVTYEAPAHGAVRGTPECSHSVDNVAERNIATLEG